MAYWIIKAGNGHNSTWRYFQCDYITDIANLPTTTKQGKQQENDTVCSYTCAPGSQCLCHEDGNMWLLGKDTDKWIKRSYSGISSDSSSEENKVIPEVIQDTEPTTQVEGDYWYQEYD